MFNKSIFCVALLGFVVGANAAGSASFGVTGTITPSPCVLTINGGGNANFGDKTTLQAQQLGGSSTVYDFGGVDMPLSVMCGHPTKVVMSFIDNLAGKNFPMDANDPIRFGVVHNTDTTAIGAYQIDLANLKVDNATPAGFFTAANGSTAWSKNGPTGLPSNYAAPGWQVGFAKTSRAITPDSLTNIAGTINLHMWVSKQYVDESKDLTTLKGAGTVVLSYL